MRQARYFSSTFHGLSSCQYRSPSARWSFQERCWCARLPDDVRQNNPRDPPPIRESLPASFHLLIHGDIWACVLLWAGFTRVVWLNPAVSSVYACAMPDHYIFAATSRCLLDKRTSLASSHAQRKTCSWHILSRLRRCLFSSRQFEMVRPARSDYAS